jgi:hypothetical protein
MPKKSYEKLKTELKNEYEKRYGKKSTWKIEFGWA